MNKIHFNFSDKAVLRLLKLIVVVYAIVLLFQFLVSCVTMKKKCIKYEKIIEIGVCDAQGNCAISTESGWIGSQKLPMEGLAVCVKYE